MSRDFVVDRFPTTDAEVALWHDRAGAGTNRVSTLQETSRIALC